MLAVKGESEEGRIEYEIEYQHTDSRADDYQRADDTASLTKLYLSRLDEVDTPQRNQNVSKEICDEMQVDFVVDRRVVYTS